MYGEPNSFVQWVNSELRYPQEAMEKGITGKVTVVFTIAKDGSVTSTKVMECSYPELEKEALRVIAFEITVTGDLENVRIVQGAHPLLDSAAIKVVRNSPRWKPATKDGVPIKTTFYTRNCQG